MTFSLGQCPAPPTCPAGQQLATNPVQPPTAQSAQGTAIMTDGSCPSYECLPTFTASVPVYNPPTDVQPANPPATTTAPVQTPPSEGVVGLELALAAYLAIAAPGWWKVTAIIPLMMCCGGTISL